MRVGLVCKHVADGAPPLFVSHQAPDDPDDSGISVHCAESHDLREWLVDDVDPYLQDLPASPPEGYVAARSGPGAPWTVASLPPEDEAAPGL